jgi:hypothetical protein
MQVHGWVASLPIWHDGWPAPRDPNHVFNLHGPMATGRDNWLSWDPKGKQNDGENFALDPGHPDAADYTVRVLSDLARNYAVDGIHLDYIRYAYNDWGYNPVNVARFNRRYDRTGQPAFDDPRWTTWRREQVTALVRRIYLSVQSIRPSVQLSAALIDWGNGPTDDASYRLSAPFARTYQDWRAWLSEGILDLGFLMAYFRTDDPATPHGFDRWTSFALANQGKRRVIIGPGVFLNFPSDSLAQIRQALALGAPGIALYSYAAYASSVTMPRSVFRDLLVGTGPNDPSAPFAKPAVPAPLPWKEGAVEAHLLGRLLGSDRAPVDGGVVTLRGPVQRSLTTDGSGTFGAIALPPGTYRVEAQDGSQTGSATAEVVPGRVASVELRLEA